MNNWRIGVVLAFAALAMLSLCMGCTKIVYRDVKVPVPVPCDTGSTELLPLPISQWQQEDQGDWTMLGIQLFLDDAMESLVILKTQRANFKERLDACK